MGLGEAMSDDAHIPDEVAVFKKKELLEMLSEQINAYERLPQHALMTPITHYDLSSLMILMLAIFRAED